MRNYKIITDSACDLPPKVISDLDLHVIPLEYGFNGTSYIQDVTDHGEKTKIFYEALRSGESSKTSMINTAQFMSVFESYLEEQIDVLHISFSSGLSGTYQAAVLAKEELELKFPERKILVVDSRAASIGLGLLLYHVGQKKRDNYSMEEIESWIEDHKFSVCHWFTVEDLNHLKKGGRISPLSAHVGTALNIKPILKMDFDGKLVNDGKVVGRKKSLLRLVLKMKEDGFSPEGQTIIIGHGDSLSDAQWLESKLQKELHVENIIMSYIGPVIGSHTGPGIIALTFLGKRF